MVDRCSGSLYTVDGGGLAMPKSRKSLSIRLQPYEGTPMAEVADYLNDLDSGTALRKVEDFLVLGLLAYARLEQDTDTE
jgi:hypothetical protein